MSFQRQRAEDVRRSNTPGGRDPSLKLPPLGRDHAVHERTMHQLQLEMEYDVQESDNDSDRPSLRSFGRHPSNFGDDVGDIAAKEIHALCVFDRLVWSPASQPRSALIDTLGRIPAKRTWGRWRWRGQPVLTSPRVTEAVMMYERGVEKGTEGRCNRCRAGQGVSPQCVVMPEEAQVPGEPGPCSNCHYDDIGQSCNALRRRTPMSSERKQAEPMGDPDRVVDHMAVLEMIASLKRPSGSARDHSLATRARRIEHAALHIAQSAKEWGEKMAKEGFQ